MPTTTNYGWTTPADTDLVKDGAAAIRTLGSSIDSTLKTQIDAQIPDSLLTTTGDVIYASGASTPARLGIGSTGQVLTVSGGLPAWGTVAAGGMTQLATGTLSGSSVVISSISQSYKNLVLLIHGARSTVSAVDTLMRLNGVSTSIYTRARMATTSTSIANTAASSSWVIDDFATLNANNNVTIVTINDYTSGRHHPMNYVSQDGDVNGRGTFAILGTSSNGLAAAITSITLFVSSNAFAGGTYILYGVS